MQVSLRRENLRQVNLGRIIPTPNITCFLQIQIKLGIIHASIAIYTVYKLVNKLLYFMSLINI